MASLDSDMGAAVGGGGAAAGSAAAAAESEATGGARPRLMITHLTLENFKSYGGIKEIGPFHKSFSSVVGPNGSGKSNVIDAMLFVFGLRAKKLRQSKLSGLIHNSAANPGVREARVTVHFQEIVDRAPLEGEDESDAFDVVEDSAFTVTRRVRKSDGEKESTTSTYYISDKVSSFTEVGKLLREKGIDLDHNRFLILQGEVEQISLMKPKGESEGQSGLLEYLEDIIGSNRYVDEIAAAGTKLEEVSEQRSERLQRVKVVEKERDALASDKAEAEALLAKEGELLVAQHRHCSALGLSISKALATAEEKKASLEERQTVETGRLEAEEKTVEEATKAEAEAEASSRAANAEADKMREAFKELDRRDIALTAELRSWAEKHKRFKTAAAQQRKRGATLREQADALAESLPALEQAAKEAEEERVAAEEAKAAAYAAVSEKSLSSSSSKKSSGGGALTLKERLEQVQTELAPLAERKAEAAAALVPRQAALELARARHAEAVEARTRVERDLAATRAKMAETQKAEREAAAAAADAKTRREEAAAALAEARSREQSLSDRLRAARSRASAAQQSAGERRSQDRLLHSLARATLHPKKSSPEMASSGFRGRLGDLGSIDAKYDAAISTACGMLDSLVVDTAEGGQRCIEYLRENDLGRARFIALDKIAWVASKMYPDTNQQAQGDEDAEEEEQEAATASKSKSSGGAASAAAAAGAKAMETPEGVPRLFDLVRPVSEDLRPAFFFALRNTLVAEDLDQAVRIAYVDGKPAWRVVTLAGEIIDTSGTMSGGGRNTARRGAIAPRALSDLASMSSTSGGGASAASAAERKREQEKEVRAATKEADTLAADLAESRSSVAALEREVSTLDSMLLRAETRVTKTAATLASLEDRLKDLEERLTQLENGQVSSGAGASFSATSSKKSSSKKSSSSSKKSDAAEFGEWSVEELEKEVDELRRVRDETAAAAEALEKEAAELEADLLGDNDPEVQAATKRAEEATELAAKTDAELARTRVDVEAARKAADKAEAAAEEAQGKKAEAAAEIERLSEQKRELEAEAGKAMDAKETVEAEAERAAEAKEAAAAARNEAEGRARKIRVVLEEINEALEECKRQLKGVSTKKAELETQHLRIQKAHASLVELCNDINSTALVQPSKKAMDIDDEEDLADADADTDAEKKSESDSPAKKEAQEDDDEEEEEEEEDSGVHVPPLVEYDEETMASWKLKDLQFEASVMEQQHDELKRGMTGQGLKAIKAWRTKAAEYAERVAELEIISRDRDAARATYEGLRKQRLDSFMAGFAAITLKLKEMYQMITLGGDAELELVDSLDPFSDGIVFSVRPPKKSWKNIVNLSGGEKTLASLALVFALHHYKPTPLYVMDEIDAALDFRNVSVIANYIKQRTKDAQFIIISLRNNMFELADRLVGIYKTHDVTKSVAINPKEFVAVESHTGL